MLTVTIKIAGAGTLCKDGTTSRFGHMWYSLDDGNGNTESFGFSPVANEGLGCALGDGMVNKHDQDDDYYLSTDTSITIPLTQAQYDAMKNFGKNPTGFSSYYSGLWNSCIDFVWAALGKAGLNPSGFDGFLWPTWNDITIPFKNIFFPPPPSPEGANDILPNSAAPSYSPIIIDLDGDGVETLGVGSGVQYDLDNNGFQETVGWAGADDGLLALDRNGDGSISGGLELFGNHTTLADGNKAANGFVALAEFDGNNDGRIDENDAVYADLRVWRDVNANGVSEAGELLTLAEAGVSRLNLANTYSTTIDAEGNAHRQVGSYVDADGNTQAMTDVWFDVDPTLTKPVNDVPIPEEIAALPEALGSWETNSWAPAI